MKWFKYASLLYKKKNEKKRFNQQKSECSSFAIVCNILIRNLAIILHIDKSLLFKHILSNYDNLFHDVLVAYVLHRELLNRNS